MRLAILPSLFGTGGIERPWLSGGTESAELRVKKSNEIPEKIARIDALKKTKAGHCIIGLGGDGAVGERRVTGPV
jgi:hypothetical protein